MNVFWNFALEIAQISFLSWNHQFILSEMLFYVTYAACKNGTTISHYENGTHKDRR